MYSFPIGVILDSFRTDTVTALDKAAAWGGRSADLCDLRRLFSRNAHAAKTPGIP